MEITALPTTLSMEKAMSIAEKRGNFLGRLLLGKKEITLKLMYLESKEIVYQMKYQKLSLPGRSGRKQLDTQKIRMLVEGTRCMPAFLEEELNTVTLQIEDEDSLQKSSFPEQKMIEEGKYLARRMVRRQSGRDVTLETKSTRSIYRPYYIAFYGELKEGSKVRYLPIPADGNEVRSTL